MKQRTITAIIALLIFIPIIYFGGLVLLIAAISLAAVGVHEFYQMKYPKEERYFEEALAIIAAGVLIIPDSVIAYNKMLVYYVVIIALMVMTVFEQKRYSLDTIGFPVFVSLYLGFGFGYLVQARIPGFTLLLYALCVVWATDIGAYLVGKAIGKHKLAPKVSPNKTIEGSIGGIICAVIVTIIFVISWPDAFPYQFWPMVGLTVFFSVAGQLGDLVESAYKRHYDVKDSGKILPGHGGILDRFDNLLFVFPIMALFGLF